jgi:O-antigen/teichoic acid export membrane protein
MSYYYSKYFKVFFTLINNGQTRSVNAKKNILISFLIRGSSIGVSLFLVPLTIHYLNPIRYGIWLTLSSIIGWFGFFDIGFGNGLRNRFAESVANGQHEQARIYVSTTYAILSIIIGLVLAVFYIVRPLVSWSKILNAPSNMEKELSILALIVFVFFCLQFVLQLISTVLTANQQPAKASLFGFLGSLFSLVIIFFISKTTSGNLIYLGTVFSITPLLVLIVSSFWYYTHEYRRYAPSIKYVKFGYVKNLLSLGIKFFIIQIAVVVLYQTSNIIIAQLFGPTQVTSYNIAYKYFSIIPMIISITLMPFWSAYTEAWIRKDIIWIKKVIRKQKMIWLILSISTIVMLVFANLIYRLWVGKEIVVPISISITLAIYVIINGWNGIYSQFLNGVGKIKLQLYSSLFGTLINIPLAIMLGKRLGIYGVIVSTCLLSVISSIWSPIQYKRLITNKAKGIWNK